MSSESRKALRDVFGFDRFRENQEEIVDVMCEGNDLCAVLPTGAGKSLCYQLPAVIRRGFTIVVSPLISLMYDQVNGARSRGIPAEFFTGDTSPEEVKRIIFQCAMGDTRLLYLSPEKMLSIGNQIKSLPVSRIVWDEAHCILMWGASFRPKYLEAVKWAADEVKCADKAAFTATATIESQVEIANKINMIEACYVRASFHRPNISIFVNEKAGNGMSQIFEMLSSDEFSGPGIVYRTTRSSVDDTAKYLSRNGIKCKPYHAGMDEKERNEIQDEFLANKITCIVATIAFGMGVDKPDIRWVIHGDISKNIEGYYQEIGRAGRDGKESKAVMLFGVHDIPIIRSFCNRQESADARMTSNTQFTQMIEFAKTDMCRWLELKKYFGEFSEKCKTQCDRCLNE